MRSISAQVCVLTSGPEAYVRAAASPRRGHRLAYPLATASTRQRRQLARPMTSHMKPTPPIVQAKVRRVGWWAWASGRMSEVAR